jgi:hypothetical protein
MRDGGRLKEGRGTLKGERKGEKGRGRERKKGTRILLTGFLLTC